MFIAFVLLLIRAPAERNVFWRIQYMPLLTERNN
jgi:hypothetical protein